MSHVIPLFAGCPVHRPCDTEPMHDCKLKEAYATRIVNIKGRDWKGRFWVRLEGETEYFGMTLREVNMILNRETV